MYPPHHLGGYELSCRDCVERWRLAGHTVEVLTTTMRVPDVTDPPDERSSGVRRELEFYWRDHVMLSPSLRERIRIERHNRSALSRALAEVAPDVVSVWHMGAMSMGLITTLADGRVPMVLSVCDDWLTYGPDVDAWMRIFLSRPWARWPARLITGLPTTLPALGPDTVCCFNSDWVRQRALARSRIPLATTTVVYSGIDHGDFPPTPRDAADWGWRLLCVGRQEERKGTHIAVRALRRLPREAHLDVIGPADGRYIATLRSLATELGIGDRLAFDVVARDALRERYLRADALLFPVMWEEPFGLVPLEAMACGLPVIATGTGGSAEFLADGVNCLLVPVGDDEALATAVRRLASDAELRARLITGGLATAAELSVDRLASVLEEWHRAAAERFENGHPVDVPPPRPGTRSTDASSATGAS